MRSMLKDLTFRVHWSGEDASWVATVDQWPSLSFLHDSDPLFALSGLLEVVEDAIDDLANAEHGGEA